MTLETVNADGCILMTDVTELIRRVDRDVFPLCILLGMAVKASLETAARRRAITVVHGVITLMLQQIHVIAPHFIDWFYALLT
jgi:hypothetical protein